VWRKAAIVVTLLAVLAVDIHGFSLQNLFAQHIWDTVGLQRLARFAGLFLAIAVPVLLMAPWTFAGLVLLFVAVGTAISVGPLPVIAVALFLVSSYTSGSKLVGESHLLSTLTGAGIYIFLMTVLSRFPVNYPAVWASILLAPILLNWRSLPRRVRFPELRSWPDRCAAAFLAFVLLMHWLVVLEPEKSADGLAMHLAIATNIAHRHAFTFEPAVYVWAAMPEGADFASSIVYQIGGEYAARLLNFAMLLLLVALLYRALRSTSIFLPALFATTPLVQLVTGSLFVENTLAAMILGAISAIWAFGETRRTGFLYAAAILSGTALAVKLGALSFLLFALPFLIWEVARLRPPVAACALAVLLFLVAGLPPYAVAWWKTGNPIFPFKNEKIHSPLLDPTVAFQDNEFRQPLAWTNPFDLTFRTHSFYEGQNGTLGFQYLLFLPLGFLAALLTRSRRAVSAIVIAVGAAILILRSEPNARYLYAAMPLLIVPFGELLSSLKTDRTVGGILLAAACICAVLNLYFLPGSGWYHKDFHMRSPFSPAARERYLRDYIPIRPAIAQFNRVHPGASIFLANDEDVADPLSDVYQDSWHQYNHLEQLRKARTLPEMTALFEKWGVHYFAWRKTDPSEQRDPPLLDHFLEQCTVLEYQIDQIRLSRLGAGTPACSAGTPAGVLDR
jgi:hypothetical protein